MTTELQPAPTPTDVALCDTCRHEDSRHDTISRRYCAATLAGALTRDCICAGQ